MSPTTTAIFDFLQQHPACSIQRFEVESGRFSRLRFELRTILLALLDSGDPDALEVARRLRAVLSEWLTSPVPFDGQLRNAIELLGTAAQIEQRWGKEIRSAFDTATEIAQSISGSESPARVELQQLIRIARLDGRALRIYCHRSAAPHYHSLALGQDVEPLIATEFIHTPREYRDAEPFETLVKFGPLRAFGWGAAPDSLLSAPRFESLVQVTWSGCYDEPLFGYDPVCNPEGHTQAHGSGGGSTAPSKDGIRWTRAVTRVVNQLDEPSPDLPTVDDFELFRSITHADEDNRKVIVAQVDKDYGMPLPPHAQILSLDPRTSPYAVQNRLPIDTLAEGMYIVKAVVDDLDLGSMRAGEGRLSRVWKDRLREQFKADASGLCARLRAAGIHLLQLYSCVVHWCRPATTVIHAPQQKRHFEILIQVLRIDPANEGIVVRGSRVPWWQMAWREIAHARGEAIQTGFQEQQIVDEQVIEILRRRQDEVTQGVQSGENFRTMVEGEHSLRGEIRLFKILSMEGGYEVPHHMVEAICELTELEQWRA